MYREDIERIDKEWMNIFVLCHHLNRGEFKI